MGPSDVRQMLEDEYTLLAQCHAFKTEFDELARRFDVTPTGKNIAIHLLSHDLQTAEHYSLLFQF